MADEMKPAGQEPAKPETKPEAHGAESTHVPKDRFDQVWARAKAAEEQLEGLKKAQEAAEQKRLEDSKKFQELYEREKAKAADLEPIAKSLQAYFDDEIADLSDDHKALIPDGPMHVKLAWVKKAKKSGLFADKANPNPGTFTRKPGAGATPWHLTIKSDDPRFQTLTPAQYSEWKAANKKPNATMPGGF